MGWRSGYYRFAKCVKQHFVRLCRAGTGLRFVSYLLWLAKRRDIGGLPPQRSGSAAWPKRVLPMIAMTLGVSSEFKGRIERSHMTDKGQGRSYFVPVNLRCR